MTARAKLTFERDFNDLWGKYYYYLGVVSIWRWDWEGK